MSYRPPSGPPPGQQQYSRPAATPPTTSGGSNNGSYGPPSGPPPSFQQTSHSDYNYAGQDIHHSAPGSAPPQQQQSYNGQTYSYSNNTGKRKALLIGINYFGQQAQLAGCINDAMAIKRYLMDHGYQEQDMVILTDDQQNPMSIPTRDNMIRAMHWLVQGAQPNDSLFFHYSGHGSQVKDLNGDEASGYDETICPVDYASAGMIIDDDLFTILVRPLPQGCRLTALFDSCHSGTALDLPFMYSTKGVVKDPSIGKEVGMGLLSAATQLGRSNDIGAVMAVGKTLWGAYNSRSSAQRNRVTNFSPADVISFSGCSDNQTSADASQGGTRAGAMSYSFLQVMAQNPNQTYLSLLQNVRNTMAGKFQQKPQLSSSHPIDMNLKFTI